MEEIWLLLECLNILIQIPISPQCCNINLLIYWLCWVVMCGVCTSCGEQGYSPVAVCGRAGLLPSGCVRASRATLQWLCAGFRLQWLLSLWNMGFRHTGFRSCGLAGSVVAVLWPWSLGSVVVAHGLR